MATLIDKVIDVTLTYGSAVIETARFDIPLIVAAHNSTANTVEVFTSPDAMQQAGFATDSPAYKMASLMFQGVGAPGQVIVGKREISNYSLGITALADTTYTVTLKRGPTSKMFSFTSDSSPTVAEIASGLQALILGDSVWGSRITASTNSTGLVLTPVQGSFVDVSAGANIATVRTATSNILDDLAEIADENDTWFWLVSDSHLDADVMALAGYVQANDKIYWFSSQDPDVVEAEDGNILSQVSLAGYSNTGFAMWRTDADTVFPEAAIPGAMAAAQPGTTTLHGKTLIGVTVQKLSTTQETNIVAQNGNIYRREYGANFYRDGRMVDGGFCDTTHHALWMKARVRESLYGLLKRQSDLLKGVRFTAEGLAQIYQAIWDNPVNIGILNKSIADEINVSKETGQREDLRPTIYVPNRADLSTNDIAERVLNGVVVEYVYAGFIHYVRVKINVLIDR